ncbi:ATP-binding cassette, subfamily B [Actinomadura madurae]|uniref:ATP-binding cassette, subfamily B n=1 Tax=Actinomadura madurae TaxID=1993 RepID=A0A1I5P5K7_9ACTN|nr:ABC transporter ATP-binding protein [Actinomadura madurae]SFP29325.1 ATP-binding cassette, subfamily B [Actinomadura madurae]
MTTPGGSRMGPLSLRPAHEAVPRRRVKRGTMRRMLPYARPYRWQIALLLSTTVLDACIAAASPLVLKLIIDRGIARENLSLVVGLSLGLAGLALVAAVASFVQNRASGRVGEGIVYELRTAVFAHVQHQPLAFFTRVQTGKLISRLNADVMGARQALTILLSQALSALLTLLLGLAAMFYVSWQITLAALAMIPLFLIPGRKIGHRLQRLSRAVMEQDAEMSSMMTERFNVAGALLAKLYGRVPEERELFAAKAGRLRDAGVTAVTWAQFLPITVMLLTSFTTALVYGLGGALAIDGALGVGSLVAMVALLLRLYGPINQLSSMQSSVMTALVSFDRVFEVLDLRPLVAERPGARALPVSGPSDEEGRPGGGASGVEFENVFFRYPAAEEVSLASLESAAQPATDRVGASRGVLHDLSFHVPAGTLTALVGPSGAGKTTITHLVPRLYDPTSGTVRIGGHDVRDLTFASLGEHVGVVTQDAHLFNDTLRANLLYARPDAGERDLVEACKAALIWDTIESLPDGLDTMAGDRGYRFSGGEKQRIALARLLVKAPPIVVLDEATAHLDSESEARIQRALTTALAGRTSLVIAHRLSTVREADQILVIDSGTVRQCGTHDSLLAEGGLYADLYHRQFAGQAAQPADAGER